MKSTSGCKVTYPWLKPKETHTEKRPKLPWEQDGWRWRTLCALLHCLWVRPQLWPWARWRSWKPWRQITSRAKSSGAVLQASHPLPLPWHHLMEPLQSRGLIQAVPATRPQVLHPEGTKLDASHLPPLHTDQGGWHQELRLLLGLLWRSVWHDWLTWVSDVQFCYKSLAWIADMSFWHTGKCLT